MQMEDDRNRSALRMWCCHAMEIMWLGAALLIPLTVNPWSENSFELPKAILVRVLLVFTTTVSVIRVTFPRDASGGQATRRIWPLNLPPTGRAAIGLVLCLALATMLSTNQRLSMWGSYARQQGLLTWIGYVALFLLAASRLRTCVQLDRLWTCLVWGSAPVVAYGLLQAFGLDPVQWETDARSRVLSTLGRSNFLGSYLVLVAPLTVGRIVIGRRRRATLALLLGQLVCLILAQARAAWLSFAVASLAFAVAWPSAALRRWIAVSMRLAGALALVGVLFLFLGNPLSVGERAIRVERLVEVLNLDAGSVAARLTIWRTTLSLLADRPWLGYGPETMSIVFARVFPPELVYYQGRQVVVDRAHNLWLDLAMSAGIPAVLAFVGLLVGLAKLAWVGLQEPTDRWKYALWVSVTAAVVGHLVDMQFGFSLTSAASVFWLLLAMGSALSRGLSASTLRIGREAPSLSTQLRQESTLGLIRLLPVIPAIALVWLLALRPMAADAAHAGAQDGRRSLEDRLAAGLKAVRLWRLEPEYHKTLAMVYAERGEFEAAEGEMIMATGMSDRDPWMWASLGNLYAGWGDLLPDRLVSAERAYQQAAELAPNVARFHRSLGWVYLLQGRAEAAVSSLERAVELDATDALAYQYLAVSYSRTGHEGAAAAASESAHRLSSTQ